MLTLYNENDQRLLDIKIYEVNEAEMGECTITCSVQFSVPTTFHPNWYVMLDGEKYSLGVTAPTGKKSTAQINTEYTLTFHSAREDLKRYTFMDFVNYGSGNPQPSQHTFSVQACTLSQFVSRFNINLQYYVGSLWSMVLSSDADGTATADLSFDKASLWDILLKVYENYGARWSIASVNNVMTITVGANATELSTIFEYGNGKGLVSVERTNSTERIITRLRGKGGEKNLPMNYFHSATTAFPIADPDTNSVLQNVYFSRLYPKNYRDYVKGYNSGTSVTGASWAYQQGVADKVAGRSMNIVDYAISSNESLRGISYGAVEDNDDIYPTIQGITRDGSRIDTVLAVSQVYVDSPEAESTKIFTSVSGDEGTFQGRDMRITYNGRDGGIKNVNGINNAIVTEGKSSTFTLTSSLNTLKAKLLITPTKYADFYANATGVTTPVSATLTTVEEMAEAGWQFNLKIMLINNQTGATMRTWTASNQDFFDIEVEDIAAGTYYFKSWIQWYRVSGTQDKLLYTIEWSLYGCEFLNYSTSADKKSFSETFDIWIGNVWNSTKGASESDETYAVRVWSALASNDDMTVMFSDGLLAGEDYEFPIVGATANADDLAEVIKKAIHYDTSVTGSHWRLTLKKSDAEYEASGKYLPNSVINAVAGNHFFFTNIQMPYDPYIYNAEQRLQTYLESQLLEVDTEYPTYTISPSSVFMGSLAEVANVKPGNKIRLRDASLIGSSYTTMYIQSVAKRYTADKINPSWTIIVSDEILATGNPISILEGKVETISQQIYTNSQSVKSLVNALSSYYLRKDGLADTSYSPTTFDRNITLCQNLSDKTFQRGDVGGQGFSLYTDEDGNRVVEADILVARLALRANELVINQVEYVGGQRILSPAAMTVIKVEDLTSSWRCYFDTKEGTVRNLFVVNDLAFCQRFKGSEEGGYTTYWAKVTAIGSDYIEISQTDKMSGGSGTPSVGDNIIQLGNSSDTDRQSAIILSSYGGNSPSIKLFHGISSYTTSGKDVFGVEYDSTNQIPYFYNYGSMRLGAKETDTSGGYILYNHSTGDLSIKAKVTFISGSSGLTNLTEWTTLNARINAATEAANTANAAIQAINGDTVLSISEKIALRSEWEAINGAASTTTGGTTGSYYMTKNDFDTIAWSGSPRVFIYNGVTYTYEQRALVYELVGINDMDTAYLSLRTYLDDMELYENTNTSNFNRATLAAKLTAMYDSERKVYDCVAQDTKTKADNSVSTANAAQTKMNSWIADGVISPLELIEIKDEKSFIVSDYDEIVESCTQLSITYTTLTTYYNTYVGDLNTIINATPDTNGNRTIPTDFATHQASYYTARTTILKLIAAEFKDGIDDAQDAADAAQDMMDSWIADGVISPLEIIEISGEKVYIVSDYDNCIKKAGIYNVSYTALTTAYNTYLGDLTTILNATPDENGNVEIPTDFATHQNAYYNARTTLLAAVSVAIDDLNDSVAEDIQDAQDAADAAQDTADAADDRMDGWIADGVLSKAEMRDVKKEKQFVISDYAEAAYDATKYSLTTTTEYASFVSAYNTYIGDLNNATSGTGTYAPDEDGNVAIPTNFATHQSAYYTARTALLKKIYDTIKGKLDDLADDIGDLDFLTNAFSGTEAYVSGGLYLGSLIGVRNNSTETGSVVAGMNGSATAAVGYDNTHGTLMFFAGVPIYTYDDPDTTYAEKVALWDTWLEDISEEEGEYKTQISPTNQTALSTEKASLISSHSEMVRVANDLNISTTALVSAYSAYLSYISTIQNTTPDPDTGYIVVTTAPDTVLRNYYTQRKATIQSISLFANRVTHSAFKVYNDGHVVANDIELNEGKIGGFTIKSTGIYYGSTSSTTNLRMTPSGCYFPNTQIDGAVKTRLSGTGSQNFISLATADGQPIVRINAQSLSTASVPTYMYLNDGTTILDTGASGWWSTLTINYWYNLLTRVLPTTNGTLTIPSFKLYYSAGWVHSDFTVKVAVIKWYSGTEISRYEYYTRTGLGGETVTLTVPALNNYAVDSYYSYGVYVYIGGALKNGMNNSSHISVTTDSDTYAVINYTSSTSLTKGVFVGANGINLTMGDYSKFLYIVPSVTFNSGNVLSDSRSIGGNFEVSLKAQNNDSVGMRIVGYRDANGNITSDGAMIYFNLGAGGGWKKLTVESDGTLKLT